ncbi:hypothetical protein G6F22_017559 [Rhizopus arrhizus]|nr:hypothetical protein G6F22_017559 [Rhizopus arrhizus]
MAAGAATAAGCGAEASSMVGGEDTSRPASFRRLSTVNSMALRTPSGCRLRCRPKTRWARACPARPHGRQRPAGSVRALARRPSTAAGAA